jgi:hypothetical protein
LRRVTSASTACPMWSCAASCRAELLGALERQGGGTRRAIAARTGCQPTWKITHSRLFSNDVTQAGARCSFERNFYRPCCVVLE